MKEAQAQPGRFSGIRLIIGVVSLVISVGLVRSIVDHWHKRAIVSERQEALRREEERNRALVTQLAEATSAAFIEKEAREKLGLVKEGDTIVLLDKSQNSTMGDDINTEDGAPSWKKWWKLFF